ncbi:MAG: SidA/IucD/PvdA family monooxygenase [Bacteroidetes bacterium]|nr:SidA/IucD/PvdA family monooxygenase [Bacteroidota bacterium]
MNHTLILGAGPAGLAMAGRLRAAGQSFDVLEQFHGIAPSWQNHYRRLHLHTVKKFSNLPGEPLLDSLPKYVPRQDLVNYYQHYAASRGIEPIFGQTVSQVRHLGGHWQVNTQDRTFEASQVVVATGFNRRPKQPKWAGEEQFGGEILHSRHYRSAEGYRGKKVLVVGFGNTGAEIALDLLEQGALPSLSVRSPVNVVPRDFLGNATQESAMVLSKLPTFISDPIGQLFQRLAIGDLTRYGLRKPPEAPAWQQRTLGKTPVMDIGTVAAIKRGAIPVFPGILQYSPGQVHFVDSRSESFDAVILATGYAAAVEEFLEDASSLLNNLGVPSGLWFDHKPGLYFLGFDAYSNGLLWSIREDSGKILNHMLARQAQESPSTSVTALEPAGNL